MTSQTEDAKRVRVWFGTHCIATHTADPERARRYAALMAQRFAGLKVTIDSLPVGTGGHGAPLPHEALWDRTVQ